MGYTWEHMYISKIGIDKSKNNFALASQGEGVSLTVTGADQRWFRIVAGYMFGVKPLWDPALIYRQFTSRNKTRTSSFAAKDLQY